MPKDIIHDMSDSSPFNVKVGWTADCEVQVGVESDEGQSLFWILIGTTSDDDGRLRRLAELGAKIREKTSLAPMPAADDIGRIQSDAWLATETLNALDTFTIMAYSGVWASLDRRGCNQLIKSVRKARDSAYGRDE